MTKIIDWDTKLPWVSLHDIAFSIANIIENPENWIGKEIDLVGDVKSMAECKKIFKKVNGKQPFRIILPEWLFRKMAKVELIKMWEWINEFSNSNGEHHLWKFVENTKRINPSPLDIEMWLEKRKINHLT